MSASAATLEAVHIPWFDTTARQMREAILPARRIRFARAQGDRSLHDLLLRPTSAPGLVGYVAGFVAFLTAILILQPKPKPKPSPPLAFARLRVWLEMRAVLSAARSGNAHAFRSAVCELARRTGSSRTWLAVQPVRAELTKLDLHIFAAIERERPDLGAIAATIRDAWLRCKWEEADPIMTLDGPAPIAKPRGMPGVGLAALRRWRRD